MRKFLVLIVIVSFGSCNRSEMIFDAKALKGKSTDGIHAILGEPDSIYVQTLEKQYEIHFYKNRDMQVRLINGEIVDIIIQEPCDIKFSPESILKFGFDIEPPTEMDTASHIMWKDIEGLRYVSIYKRGTLKQIQSCVPYNIYLNYNN